MFIFGKSVERRYAEEIYRLSESFGRQFCEALDEDYDHAEKIVFVGFVYILFLSFVNERGKYSSRHLFKEKVLAHIHQAMIADGSSEIPHNVFVNSYVGFENVIQQPIAEFLDSLASQVDDHQYAQAVAQLTRRLIQLGYSRVGKVIHPVMPKLIDIFSSCHREVQQRVN